MSRVRLATLLLTSGVVIYTIIETIIITSHMHGEENWSTVSQQFTPKAAQRLSADRNDIVILLWTPFGKRPAPWNRKYHIYDWLAGGGRRVFWEADCPERRCVITADRDQLSEAKIVVVNTRELEGGDRGLPHYHHPQQQWLFYSHESPVHTWASSDQKSADLSAYDGVFNLTATYMTDSDVPMPYGVVVRRERSEKWQPTPKSGLILWLVSNCNTPNAQRRNSYVQELRQHTDVHVYGRCGMSDPCIHPEDREDCINNLRNSYRFYLAFENSQCVDYISEKFWKTLATDSVPIVMGTRIENYEKVAPPNSFLHVDNFSSPLELAEYVNYLSEDEVAYRRYLFWHQDFVMYRDGRAMCRMCELAHQNVTIHKTYNISQWFSYSKLCKGYFMHRTPKYKPKVKHRDLLSKKSKPYIT